MSLGPEECVSVVVKASVRLIDFPEYRKELRSLSLLSPDLSITEIRYSSFSNSMFIGVTISHIPVTLPTLQSACLCILSFKLTLGKSQNEALSPGPPGPSDHMAPSSRDDLTSSPGLEFKEQELGQDARQRPGQHPGQHPRWW